MIASLSSMTVSTPNDMYQVVGALALATAQPGEVSRQSQVYKISRISRILLTLTLTIPYNTLAAVSQTIHFEKLIKLSLIGA